MAATATDFKTTLKTRFGGVLRHGAHPPDGEACALEVASVVRTGQWTDSPGTSGLPDLRPLNDGPWSSDKTRTKAVVPVVLACWGWGSWTDADRKRWAERVAIRTVAEVLPVPLRGIKLSEAAATCAAVTTLAAARSAAWSAARSARWAAESAARAARAAESAAWSARWAAESAAGAAAAWSAAGAAGSAAGAARAAWAAGSAAGDKLLRLACRIWTEEGNRIEEERAARKKK